MNVAAYTLLLMSTIAWSLGTGADSAPSKVRDHLAPDYPRSVQMRHQRHRHQHLRVRRVRSHLTTEQSTNLEKEDHGVVEVPFDKSLADEVTPQSITTAFTLEIGTDSGPHQEDDEEQPNGEGSGMDAKSQDGQDTLDQEMTMSSNMDILTNFLRIVETQHILGNNCTLGTERNLGEGVVDRYAQDRFRLEAEVAVNRANFLTRLWKYAADTILQSEYILYTSVRSMVEFDDDIFAGGNCYDQLAYREYSLFCPFAFRRTDGIILAKNLAEEYKYLSNTSEWFYHARKSAERIIRNFTSFRRGYNKYPQLNESGEGPLEEEEILSVSYEDGKWSKPYFDCGGGNIWMLTYTVPFFGYTNGTYTFKGTSGIDVDLRRVDIDQCPQKAGSSELNIFAASDKCKTETTQCVLIPGLGFRRGSYKCVCKDGYFFPDTHAEHRYYNGTVIEEEYEKKFLGKESIYDDDNVFGCLQCPEGCDTCVDDRPCIVTLNWVMRTTILILTSIIIGALPIVALFTWKYGHLKVVKAASPVLLRIIVVGAFLAYSTLIVMYPRPNVITCTMRVWLREIGFSLSYGALMLKTWRISVIFRVRSAKAVKITDLDLIKRLGFIVGGFAVFLAIRTVVATPHVIVGRTADDLKAFLCSTDWWDHACTILEMLFLLWGVSLCIVVRKAPSEFNESKFISMAIYNEFLLSIFLNISMIFLQSPANPDLLYIIVFCHSQLTITLLLCLIFGSKAFMVLKGQGRDEELTSTFSKPSTAKFIVRPKSQNSTQMAPASSSTSTGRQPIDSYNAKITEMDVQEEFKRLYVQLEVLKEKNMRLGNRHLAAKINAMQAAAHKEDYQQQEGEVIASSHGMCPTVSTPPSVLPAAMAAAVAALAAATTTSTTISPNAPTSLSTENEDFVPQRTLSSGSKASSKSKLSSTSPSVSSQTANCHESQVEVVDEASAQDAKGILSANRCNKNTGTPESSCARQRRNRSQRIVINLDDKSRFTDEVTV